METPAVRQWLPAMSWPAQRLHSVREASTSSGVWDLGAGAFGFEASVWPRACSVQLLWLVGVLLHIMARHAGKPANRSSRNLSAKHEQTPIIMKRPAHTCCHSPLPRHSLPPLCIHLPIEHPVRLEASRPQERIEMWDTHGKSVFFSVLLLLAPPTATHSH